MTGTYNPHANQYGEKLITLNFDRIKHWLVVGAQPTVCLNTLCMHACSPAPWIS